MNFKKEAFSLSLESENLCPMLYDVQNGSSACYFSAKKHCTLVLCHVDKILN